MLKPVTFMAVGIAYIAVIVTIEVALLWRQNDPHERMLRAMAAANQAVQYSSNLEDIDRASREASAEVECWWRLQSCCQMSWMAAEAQAASFVPSLKITPAITSGSNTLPLSFRQWF